MTQAGTPAEPTMGLSSRLAALLKCILCEGALVADVDGFHCPVCDVSYPVVKGVPVMYPGIPGSEVVTKMAVTPRAGIKNALRRSRLMEYLWHLYLRIDAMLGPTGPSYPEFWIGRIKKQLPQSPISVLDFGGGAGNMRAYLAAAQDGYLVLEPKLASPNVQDNLTRHQYVIGDGHTDLFQERVFDVIAMFEVLEHMRNPFVAFRNCARWLKPGGVLVLSTPQYWHVHGWPSDYFRYTRFGLEELARTAGLKVEDCWDMGGPCLMIWSAIRLNFTVLNLPLLRQLIIHPAYLLARLGDAVFFPNNMARRNPDTRGWMLVARKPVSDAATRGP